MVSRSKTLKKYIRISLAGLMSVWLSGVVFLFCCERINANTGEAESCPLAKMSLDDCPIADAAVIKTVQENCVDCCGFLPVVFDKNRKIEQNEKQITTASNVPVIKFDPSAAFDYTAKPAAIYSRVAYHNDLSVRYCVFRS